MVNSAGSLVSEALIGTNMRITAARAPAQEHANEAAFERRTEDDEKYAAQQLQKQSELLKKLLALRDVASRL